jgi:asparagine synthase (glutamine-hydrolysing)
MNRIAGIFNFDDTPVDSGEIHRMIRAMRFQSQDEPWLWIEGKVGFGCISIGKTSGAKKDRSPCFHQNHQWVITFDGRIDNRQELLAALISQLVAGDAPISDEEIVLAAYEKWGRECPKHLIGDFAFAIWDKKKHRLICVRDHFGVKPFYYYLSKESFVFASTPHALLASGKVPPVIHEERIADFLVNPLEGIDKTSSFYSDVFRLPPAHMLLVQAQGMTLERYWELGPTVQPGLRTEAEYLESFQELFTESIRCRLRNVTSPASMLSGGMDSSAIVGMGRKLLAEEGKSLHAFAVLSNSAGINRETPYIYSVLDQGNLQSHLISETELFQWMDELVKVIEVEAEPFDSLMNLNRAVYLHAQDHGISALLDGIDGDVLLSGSGHLTQLWRQGAYRTIIGETLKAEGLTAEYKMGRRLFINSLLSAITPFPPDRFRNLRQLVRYGKALRSAIRDTLIDREFAVRSHLGERFATLDSHSPRPRSFSQMDAHKIALKHPFLTVGLERYGRVASAFGIEARHPFTDVRLAEFCLGLPWQLKTHHGWTKLILRRVLEPQLPSEVIWRKDKDSLMWEVNRLILKERAEYFYQITLDEQANLRSYIDLRKLMKFWQNYLTLGDEKHAELIWSGVALAMWLRHQRNMNAGLR